jgi:hypothetical protein
MNIRVLIPVVLAAVMAVVVKVAFRYPYIQAKLSILFCGGLVFVLALVQLSRELRSKKERTDGPQLERKESEDNVSPLQYGLELTWMVGFGLTIYLLGFIAAIPLCVCAYMKSHGSRWLTSIITGVMMSTCCYVIFVLFLDMRLHSGVIFPSLSP